MKIGRIYLILSVFIIISVTLEGSVFKGQREYMKKCKVCHGNGAKIAKSKTSDEWKALFDKNGIQIKILHEKDHKAMKYFLSERFKKNSKHLLDFFVKYAADSGNVPACSD